MKKYFTVHLWQTSDSVIGGLMKEVNLNVYKQAGVRYIPGFGIDSLEGFSKQSLFIRGLFKNKLLPNDSKLFKK